MDQIMWSFCEFHGDPWLMTPCFHFSHLVRDLHLLPAGNGSILGASKGKPPPRFNTSTDENREWRQPGSRFLSRVTVHLEAQTRFSALCQSPASKAFEVSPSAAFKAGRRVEGTAYGSKMVRNSDHGATLAVYNCSVLQIDTLIISWNIVHDPSCGLINRGLLTLNTWRWDGIKLPSKCQVTDLLPTKRINKWRREWLSRVETCENLGYCNIARHSIGMH